MSHVLCQYSNNYRHNIDMKSTILSLIFTTLLISFFNLNATEMRIVIPEFIRLPQDSIVANKLLKSLESFLEQKDAPNGSNTLVNQDYLLETSVLLDEIKGLERSTKHNSMNFYNCYLSSLVRLNHNQYIIQLSYLGLDDTNPSLRATISLIATESGDFYLFSSPLEFNTSTWQKEQIKNNTLYYKPNFDLEIANSYFKYISKYDKILGITEKPIILYCANNFNEVLKLIGVDYKSDYSSVSYNTTMAMERDTSIIVDGLLASGVIKFDPHDL